MGASLAFPDGPGALVAVLQRQAYENDALRTLVTGPNRVFYFTNPSYFIKQGMGYDLVISSRAFFDPRADLPDIATLIKERTPGTIVGLYCYGRPTTPAADFWLPKHQGLDYSQPAAHVDLAKILNERGLLHALLVESFHLDEGLACLARDSAIVVQ